MPPPSKRCADAAFNELYMDGTVVIGEGERDEAPMLYIGEKVGSAIGKGPKIDIALDPLEGTTICAKAGPNALAVLAIAEKGGLLNAPDVYMDKIAVGPGYPEGVIDLDKSPDRECQGSRRAKGVEPSEIIACVLDRPRHEKLIAELRAHRLRHHADRRRRRRRRDRDDQPRHDDRHLYGLGRRARGRAGLRRAALRRWPVQGPAAVPQRRREARAHKWGIEDLDKHLRPDRAGQGRLHLRRDRRHRRLAARRRQAQAAGKMTTESVVMRASSGTVRWVKGEHRI
jgi:fructose-1,6-bisphosphatase II / sedoheptulose-1,7-bisphosphatase